jgi:hypothetical protein
MNRTTLALLLLAAALGAAASGCASPRTAPDASKGALTEQKTDKHATPDSGFPEVAPL